MTQSINPAKIARPNNPAKIARPNNPAEISQDNFIEIIRSTFQTYDINGVYIDGKSIKVSIIKSIDANSKAPAGKIVFCYTIYDRFHELETKYYSDKNADINIIDTFDYICFHRKHNNEVFLVSELIYISKDAINDIELLNKSANENNNK